MENNDPGWRDRHRSNWQEKLRAAEGRLGLQDGFQLVYGPWRTLETASVAFLTVNPGKGKEPRQAVLREVSDERGNTYEEDKALNLSKSPLNAQFLKLAALLKVKPVEILCGVVIPFPSTREDDLSDNQRAKALALGREFWRKPLSRPGLRSIIACGVTAAKEVCGVMGCGPHLRPEVERPAGWGKQKLRRYSAGGKPIYHLPHLSTFKLLSRDESRSILREFLTA